MTKTKTTYLSSRNFLDSIIFYDDNNKLKLWEVRKGYETDPDIPTITDMSILVTLEDKNMIFLKQYNLNDFAYCQSFIETLIKDLKSNLQNKENNEVRKVISYLERELEELG